MPWETRPWATTPNDDVLRKTRGGRLLGKRVELTLDPRSWEADDRNDLVVEGTVMAVSSDGPTLYLEERDRLAGGRYPLIDVLVVREVTA
jgi:hypothetical protein